MGRYQNTKLKKDVVRRGKLNSQSYNTKGMSSTIYSTIPKRDGDIYVITQPGDRLDNLAFQYYRSTGLWWYIAKANGLTFITVPTGTSLRIPKDARYALGR